MQQEIQIEIMSEETRRLLVGLEKLQRKLLMNNNSVNEDDVNNNYTNTYLQEKTSG
jgi:hypothetical protein